MARSERAQLCDAALEAGADAPTLCEGWTVKDLVVHLLVREGSPASVGIVVPALSGVLDRTSRRVGRRDLPTLVERLRQGPPVWSPYAVPKVDDLVNTLEYFVHLEDIRRAQPGWTARALSDEEQRTLWSMVRTAGKGLMRGAPVGVTLEDSGTGHRAVLKDAPDPVVVRGLPAEVVLFVFGRAEQADVELLGDERAVARLRGTSLGI